MQPWKRVDPTNHQTVGHRAVVTKHFVLPDDSVGDFQTFNAEGTHFAGVIALTPDHQVITAYQYRPGPEKMMYEIAGGAVNADEDYQVGAMRELKEETGYVSTNVSYLGDVYKDAYNNGTWHYYLALDCQPHTAGQQLDDKEFVEMRRISIAEFLNNAKMGNMTDVEAVFLAYDHLQGLQA